MTSCKSGAAFFFISLLLSMIIRAILFIPWVHESHGRYQSHRRWREVGLPDVPPFGGLGALHVDPNLVLAFSREAIFGHGPKPVDRCGFE